jgi:D-aspartate ligase
VVLGTNITGLAEARQLALHGVPVIGVDEIRRRYTTWSSNWVEAVITDAFNSAGLIDLLIGIAQELPAGRKPSLFISTDEQVKVVAKFGARLRDHYLFDFPEPATVDLLMSKESFAELAAKRGWPMPPTISAHTRSALVDGLRTLRYPLVLKPRLKTLASRQHVGKKAYRCATEADVLAAYDELSPWEPEVVVQEWIPGTDADVYYAFFYFASDMREVCSFEGRKIRQWIPETGSTASSQAVHPPIVTPLSREILTSTGAAGFCSVEYKRDPRTGVCYITEPTVGRVNLQLGTAIANGVDIVARAYFHVHGLPYPGRESRVYDRKWVYLSADLRSARFYIDRGDLTWGAWLKSLQGPKDYAVWRPGDTGMLFGAIGDILRRGPRALVRRARKLVGG